jgi:hypothetical protein
MSGLVKFALIANQLASKLPLEAASSLVAFIVEPTGVT